MLQKAPQKGDYIFLNCEQCEICKKTVSLAVLKKSFRPHPSGITTVIDTHGADDASTPHYRILYVDSSYSVRSFSHVTNIATEVKK